MRAHLQDRQQHDRGGEVVQNTAHAEAKHCNAACQSSAGLCRRNSTRDALEAAVCVDDLRGTAATAAAAAAAVRCFEKAAVPGGRRRLAASHCILLQCASYSTHAEACQSTVQRLIRAALPEG
jgi:hypothetical protein